MIKVKAYDGKTPFVRIGKRAARAAFNAGKPVVFCPVGLYPFGSFRPSVMIQKTQAERGDFDKYVREFENYNCTDSETGAYAAFYVEEVAA